MDKRFISNTPEEQIAHIIEECGEVIAVYGKAQRFGWDSINPLIPFDEAETNQEWFERELEDLHKAIERFYANG